MGPKCAVRLKIRALIPAAKRARQMDPDRLDSLRLNRKVQFFPIVNATISRGIGQIRFPGTFGGNGDGKVAEVAVKAHLTYPMAGS